VLQLNACAKCGPLTSALWTLVLSPSQLRVATAPTSCASGACVSRLAEHGVLGQMRGAQSQSWRLPDPGQEAQSQGAGASHLFTHRAWLPTPTSCASPPRHSRCWGPFAHGQLEPCMGPCLRPDLRGSAAFESLCGAYLTVKGLACSRAPSEHPGPLFVRRSFCSLTPALLLPFLYTVSRDAVARRRWRRRHGHSRVTARQGPGSGPQRRVQPNTLVRRAGSCLLPWGGALPHTTALLTPATALLLPLPADTTRLARTLCKLRLCCVKLARTCPHEKRCARHAVLHAHAQLPSP
jgi:hypothetical protein